MARRREIRSEGRARLLGAAAACYGSGGHGGVTTNQPCTHADIGEGMDDQRFPGGLGDAQYLNQFNASWLSSAQLDRLEGLNTRFAAEVEDWCAPHVAAGSIRRLPILLFGQIVLGSAQQYGSEIIARTDSKQAAAEVRRAGPILAEAAWRAVRADAS
jgi:hypothetical protein